MLRITNEMAFVKYNANKDNKNKGDCTIRALSLAYDKPYETVSKELRGHTRGTNRVFKTKANVEWYIKENGYEGDTPFIKADRQTVKEFSDTHPNGTYLLLTGKGESNIQGPYSEDEYENYSHLVCCIDGNIYDSWDSQNHYVKFYSIIDSEGTDTINASTRYTPQEITQYADYILDQAIHDHLLDRDGIDYTIVSYRGIVSIPTFNDSFVNGMPIQSVFCIKSDEYSCTVWWGIMTRAFQTMPTDGWNLVDWKTHVNHTVIKFSPKASNNDIDQAIEKGIVSQIKKLARAFKKEEEICDKATNLFSEFPNLDYEKCFGGKTDIYKFLNKCPDDIKQNVISVEDNTSYWGEWLVKIKALPNDENNNNKSYDNHTVRFTVKNAKQLKEMWNEYLKHVKEYNGGDTSYDYHDYY